MGLLDEAIREHLELKRRRGADPTEIERLEREALGPVRPLGQEPPGPDTLGVGTADPAEPGPVGEEFHESGDLGYEGEHHPEPEYAYPGEDDHGYPAGEPGAAEEPESYAAELGLPLTDVPEGPAPATAPEPLPPTDPPAHEDLGVETAEYDVEAAHAEEGESEDVLEETPEFLQDAPDHDRLWFEQRPPRDFDFDG